MFKKGDIVYHDILSFTNGYIDSKKNRPCIVLFTTDNKDDTLVCTCPLTSQIRSFNKCPECYYFIPDVIRNSHKLNFAELGDYSFHKESETHHIGDGINIGDEMTNEIIDKINQYPFNLLGTEEYRTIRLILGYMQLFEEEGKKKLKSN